MGRMMMVGRSTRTEHQETQWCTETGCKPKRMRGLVSLRTGKAVPIGVTRHAGEHDWEESCDRAPVCKPVEEGKSMSAVPEFTIELRYQTGSTVNGPAGQPGWKYTINWYSGVALQIERGYGYHTRDGAKAGAEVRATAIAKSLLPAERYTYTPEV
jgi:hypothetical protein